MHKIHNKIYVRLDFIFFFFNSINRELAKRMYRRLSVEWSKIKVLFRCTLTEWNPSKKKLFRNMNYEIGMTQTVFYFRCVWKMYELFHYLLFKRRNIDYMVINLVTSKLNLAIHPHWHVKAILRCEFIDKISQV